MSFSVSWVFKAINKFSGPAKKIDFSLKGLTARFKKLQVQGSKATKRLIKDFKKMKTGIAAAMATISVAVFKGGRTFMKFEDNLAELNAIVGPTAKELEGLSKSAFDMGIDASRSGADVLTAFKLIASAKPELLKNIPALKSMTKEVLLLANASGMSLADASNVAAQSLNIFGKDASHAGKFIDILAAGAKFGSSEIADTGEAVLKSGAAAKIAGIGFTTLNASIQILSSQGLKAEVAGTGLNAIFTKLAATGIPALDTKAKGLVPVLKTLEGANLSAKQMVTLFGLENIKTAQALIENADKITAMEDKLGTIGIAAEQAKIRLATLSRKLDKLGTIVEKKVVKVFDDLAPIIDKNIVAVAAWIENIKTEDVENFIEVAKGILWVFGKIADVVAVAVNSIKTLGEVMGQLAGMAAIGEFDIMKFDSTALKKRTRAIGDSVLRFLGFNDETPKVSTDMQAAIEKLNKLQKFKENILKVATNKNIVFEEGEKANIMAGLRAKFATTPPVAANDAKISGNVGVDINVRDPGQNVTNINSRADGMVKLKNPRNVGAVD